MTQHDNILFVPVPEYAVKFWTHCDDKTWLFFFSQSGWDGIDSVEIPEGDWEMFFLTDLMKEFEWEYIFSQMYKPVNGVDIWAGKTYAPVEQGKYLLQSLGITQRCAVLIKK